MEPKEIEERVAFAVKSWQATRLAPFHRPKVTPGAQQTLAYTIDMIVKDPSDRWQKVDLNAVQVHALSVIPNVLNDLMRPFDQSGSGGRVVVTSWEIWHGISDILDNWCPIPKSD